MPKKAVTSEKVGTPISPLSPAISSGGFLFISGQVALDPKTHKVVEGGIEAQTRNVFEKIKSLVKAAKLTMDDVVSVNVYLTDVKDFAKMNKIYKKYFQNPPLPARCTVQAQLVSDELLIEISAVAMGR